MNRISHRFPDVETLLGELGVKRPAEALVVDRGALIDVLRQSLTDLHEQRRRVTGTPAEPETVHWIRYWDGVLGWLKERHEPEVVFVEKLRPFPPF